MSGFNRSANIQISGLWRLITSPVVRRIKLILTSGMTPRKLIQTIGVGAALGTIPLAWGTTLLCFIAASVFRLNHVVLQAVNFLLWPVHLALLIPYYKMGMWLFPGEPSIPPQFYAHIMDNPVASCHFLGWLTIKALAVWMITMLPSTLIISKLLQNRH